MEKNLLQLSRYNPHPKSEKQKIASSTFEKKSLKRNDIFLDLNILY